MWGLAIPGLMFFLEHAFGTSTSTRPARQSSPGTPAQSQRSRSSASQRQPSSSPNGSQTSDDEEGAMRAALEAAAQRAAAESDMEEPPAPTPAPPTRPTPAPAAPAPAARSKPRFTKKVIHTAPARPKPKPKLRAATKRTPARSNVVRKPPPARPTAKPAPKHDPSLVAAARAAVAAVNEYRRTHRGVSPGNKQEDRLAAVRAFQRKDGLLSPDGEYGPNTRKAAAYYLDRSTAQLPPVNPRFAAFAVTWKPHD